MTPGDAAPGPDLLATDARLLDLATTSLRRHGPRRTTIVDIAAEAGMSHANVYRYFPSKAALFDAVTAAWLRPIEASIRIVSEGPDPAKDKLERLLLSLFRFYRDKLEGDAVLFGIFVENVRSNAASARRHRLRVQQDVSNVLEEGRAQGSFHGETRTALILTFDLCHRFIHPVSIALDADVARAAIDMRAARTVRLLLRALAAGRI